MTTRFADHLLEGDHASRPAFGAVPQGALYACSTHGLIYQSDGSTAWSTWATLGGATPNAEDVPFTPAGTIAATDVQAAIEEVAAEAVGGGGSPWTQVVNESGASFANWTGVTGTWSSTGAVIQNASSSGSNHAYYSAAKIDTSALLFEAELQFTPGGMGSNLYWGLALDHSGAAGAPNLIAAITRASTNVPIIHYGVAVRRTMTGAIHNDGTWYKLRALRMGNSITVWQDGVLVGTTIDVTGVTNANGDRIGLFSEGLNPAQFRNIKAWTLTLPA